MFWFYCFKKNQKRNNTTAFETHSKDVVADSHKVIFFHVSWRNWKKYCLLKLKHIFVSTNCASSDSDLSNQCSAVASFISFSKWRFVDSPSSFHDVGLDCQSQIWSYCLISTWIVILDFFSRYISRIGSRIGRLSYVFQRGLWFLIDHW